MNGSIVDILVNLSGTCNQLPREGTCEEVVFFKLKKKSFFKGRVYFEPVRPQRVRAALGFFQRVNPLYRDVLIRDGNVNQGNNLPERNTDFDIESDGELETRSNPKFLDQI